MQFLVPCSRLSSAQTLGTTPLLWGWQAQPQLWNIRISGPFSVRPLTSFSCPPRLFYLDVVRISLSMGSHRWPHRGSKHLFLDLISFALLNKKGLHSLLSRYGQHGRLIPQTMLVPFQVVEITVRPASRACLQGDRSKDKKKCVVSGGKACAAIFVLWKCRRDSYCPCLGWSGRAVLGFPSTCDSSVCPPGRAKCI